MSLLDLCSYLGMAAVWAVTANLLLGLLIALRYSPVRQWPHRRVNVFALHQWTAYLVLLFALSHPIVLLFLHAPRFRAIDLIWPIRSPLQPLINVLGAVALYLLLAVFVSSVLRRWLPRRLWRRLHYLVFPAALLLFGHSFFTDPLLKDGHPDLLDGGKILIAGMFVLSVVATGWRFALRGQGLRPVAYRDQVSAAGKKQ